MNQIPQIPLSGVPMCGKTKTGVPSFHEKQIFTCTDIEHTNKCECTLINDEVCGNLYFPINATGQEKLSIFNVSKSMNIQGHVTFFNNEESVPFIVELLEFNEHPKSLRILPGNTQGVFFNNLKSIFALNSNLENSKTFGKYCLRINYYNCCSCCSHSHKTNSCNTHSCNSCSCNSCSCRNSY